MPYFTGCLFNLIHPRVLNLQADCGTTSDKHAYRSGDQPHNGKTDIKGSNISASSDPDKGSCIDGLDVTSEKLFPAPSQPIAIPCPGHSHARRKAGQSCKIAPLKFLADGTQVELKENRFGEPMPRMPEIAQPRDSLRHNTNAPGTCRWNAITESWIDLDSDSSRGTWGRFKNKQRLIRQSSSDESEGLGLFASEVVTGACASTTNSIEDKWPVGKLHPGQDATQEHRQSGDSVKKRQPEASPAFMSLNTLRKLAAENEAAVESYSSSTDELVITKSPCQERLLAHALEASTFPIDDGSATRT